MIRADGNAKIGAGHLMRCMTVAEELASLRGRDTVRFVCADKESAVLAEEHGFFTCVLGTDYREMEAEIPMWRELLEELSDGRNSTGCTLLVDSYFVTDRYLSELRKLGFVVLMDDMGSGCYPVDCVVNYNAFADERKYRKLYRNRDVRLLVGGSYAPVRRQFLNVSYELRETVQNVLITTGGGDSENIAGRILGRLDDGELFFHLVTGRFNPHFRELEKLAESRSNILLYHDVKDMAGLMRQCDVAVTAAGSTVYELAAVGVPFVCFSCAQNQEALADYVEDVGMAASAGAWHKDADSVLERLAEVFGELLVTPERREMYHCRCRGLIDGKGARRLAETLVGFGKREKRV